MSVATRDAYGPKGGPKGASETWEATSEWDMFVENGDMSHQVQVITLLFQDYYMWTMIIAIWT